MNVIAFTKSASLTMSSREIAELVNSRHDNVKTTVERLVAKAVIQLPSLQEVKNHLGQTVQEYQLCKRDSLIVVAQLCPEFTARIIDRWQQLEEQVSAPVVPALPDFTNPALAARAWAEQFEARIAAESKKAEIGSRREATAMNTASLAVKKAKKLAIELDKSMQYATVKRMEMLYHGQSFNWRLLKSAAIQMDMPPADVFDANYGTVKAYHADVWRECYALEINTEPMEKSA